jgi:hypothetical protein
MRSRDHSRDSKYFARPNEAGCCRNEGVLADAYQQLDGRTKALAMADQTALNLLEAADSTSGPVKENILRGAGRLNSWLADEGDGDLVYCMNYGQALHRLGTLEVSGKALIRRARRKSRATTAVKLFQEAF